MQDFTLTAYKKLLQELLANGYSFQTLQDFIKRAEPLSRQFWELATPEEWTAYSTGQAKLRSASYARQADSHRLTQTFIRQDPG